MNDCFVMARYTVECEIVNNFILTDEIVYEQFMNSC